MKKFVYIFLFFACTINSFAQEKPSTEKAKDTIKTEVINVVTSYTPTIADAFKIRKNPVLKFSKRSEKKKLQYNIFSAPVASTFKPKSGRIKGIDVGKKERLYNNYLAGGFGNNNTPFAELFIHNISRFDYDYGLYAKYISSDGGVESSPLNSGYSDFTAGLFYGQEDRYFDWKVSLNSERKQYNWYGLPTSTNVNFDQITINGINEKQTYNFFELEGNISLEDSYIDNGNLNISYFTDAFKSKEMNVSFRPNFMIPLDFISRNWNDLKLGVSLDYLSGDFAKTYGSNLALAHKFFTFGAKPSYRFNFKGFDIKLGTKVYFTSDLENSISQVYIYPDVNISFPLVKGYANLYGGAKGDLHNNSYRGFTELNPYVSPNLFITQTNEKFNFYGGLNGKLTQNVSYNIRGSFKEEDDKPLFIRNNSKSDGTTPLANSVPFLGYEYGNSYNVKYIDLQTFSFFGEVSVEASKNLNFGANFEMNTYRFNNSIALWNLPEITGQFFARYKRNKWYAGSDIFFVGSRNAIVYNGTFPSNETVRALDSYIDLNLNGGYHFNDKFSAFLKVNNLLGNDYERFSNFNVQGLQILGGFTWKFDF